ncbi:MAG: class I SAM-dependent methyltransferase [Bacteriovoracaceae bacterium]
MKYHTIIHQRKLGEKLFVVEAIRDLDEAIDMLCDSLSADEQKDPFAPDLCPYFGIFWHASEALGDFLFHHPELVKGKRVLELGAGLGFPSMVAAYVGADVIASDFHPMAEEYFQRNCTHTMVEAKYQRLNWREESFEKFDVVMGSDVLYESQHPMDVAKALLKFVKPGGKMILSDPGRNYLPKFLEAMKNSGASESVEMVPAGEKVCLVYVFSTEGTE